MNELEQAIQKLTRVIDDLQEVEGLLWSFDRYSSDKMFTPSAERYFESSLQNISLMCSQMDEEIRDNWHACNPEIVENYLRAVNNLGRRW